MATWPTEWETKLTEYQSQGLTYAQIADAMTARFSVPFAKNGVKSKLRRMRYAKQPDEHTQRSVSLNADGTQTATALMRLRHEPNKDPRTLLTLCGYDPDQFEMVSGDYKVYEQHSTKDGTVPQYSIHVRVKPRLKLSPDEMIDEFNAKIVPVNYGMKKSGVRNLVIPLPDMHFGWTTFGDVQNVVKQLRELIMDGYDNIVIEQLGDLFHADQIHSTQTVSGTQLDHADMRQAFHDALELFEQIVPLSIEYSNHVAIKSVFGNHSGDLEYAFLYALKAKYPQAHVDLNDTNPASDWRCAFQIGHVGIMMAHGDVSRNQLTGLFPNEYKDIWCNTDTHELMTGHFHTEKFSEKDGITWRQLGTIKPNDPYEIKNGFTTGKHVMYAFIYGDTRLRCMYELR